MRAPWVVAKGWDEAKHPRQPRGTPVGGEFEAGGGRPGTPVDRTNADLDAAFAEPAAKPQSPAADIRSNGPDIFNPQETTPRPGPSKRPRKQRPAANGKPAATPAAEAAPLAPLKTPWKPNLAERVLSREGAGSPVEPRPAPIPLESTQAAPGGANAPQAGSGSPAPTSAPQGAPGQAQDGKQQAQQYRDLAAQHARKGKLAGLAGDKIGAKRGRMIAAEYRRVAGYHSLGEHDQAEAARRRAEFLFKLPSTATPPPVNGKPTAKPSAQPPPLPNRGKPAAAPTSPAAPPPLPHEKTQAAALSTANELSQALRAGDPKAVAYARDRFESALQVHQREGFAAIDRMAREKYGGMKARRAAIKAKRAFVAKLEAARDRLGGLAMTGKGFGGLVLDLDPLPGPPWVVTKGTDTGGRWITIGGKRGADGKRHGGSPVFIKDGKITKGHPSLTGKKIGALKEDAEPTSHRGELNQGRAYDRAVWRKKARKAGHDPEHLEQLAGEVKAHHDAFASERKEVLQHARQFHKANGHGDLSNLGGRRNVTHLDAATLRGFDLTAEDAEKNFPHHFREEAGEHGSHGDQLFDMLTAGDPAPMTHAEAYEHAFENMGEPPPKRGRKKPAADSFDFGANEKALRAPWVVTKARDVRAEPRDVGGQWTAGGEGEGPTDPDSHARKLASRIGDVPHAVRQRVSAFVRRRYAKLSSRYGDTGAKAILGAAVLMTPLPIPGTTLLPIALAEIVLRLRRMTGKAMGVSDDVIQTEARRLLADLYAEMGEKQEKSLACPRVVRKGAGHDVSNEPRDDAGQWTAEGAAAHKENVRGLLAKAKEARRTAHEHAKAGAAAAHESAGKAADAIHKANSQLSWTSGDDHFDAYRELDELVSDYDPDGTVADRMAALKDISIAAKSALAVGPNEDDEEEDRLTEKDIAANQPHLKAILAHAKAAREALRTHAAARREMAAIRDPSWLEKCFRGLLVTKGPWVVKSHDVSAQPRDLDGRWMDGPTAFGDHPADSFTATDFAHESDRDYVRRVHDKYAGAEVGRIRKAATRAGQLAHGAKLNGKRELARRYSSAAKLLWEMAGVGD